ncbi:MAG TPA: hypothetical protein PKI15_08650 [Candidatus Cloacimonadota bacterium]|nr:hypothetical protein [Candidatus Cloacimonadota bacterium]
MKQEDIAIFTEPKKISIASRSIIELIITLPTGVLLKLKPGRPYTTSNAEEIEFMSKQKGVMIQNVSDDEYRRHYTKLFNELPSVCKEDLSPEEVMAAMWSTLDEKQVIEKLTQLGYTIGKEYVKTDPASLPADQQDKSDSVPTNKMEALDDEQHTTGETQDSDQEEDSQTPAVEEETKVEDDHIADTGKTTTPGKGKHKAK